jgi:hypothetical protein
MFKFRGIGFLQFTVWEEMKGPNIAQLDRPKKRDQEIHILVRAKLHRQENNLGK